MPSRMTRKSPASVVACRKLPVVRSGPSASTPPFASTPWQLVHFDRKNRCPIRTSMPPVYGFSNSSAATLVVNTTRSSSTFGPPDATALTVVSQGRTRLRYGPRARRRPAGPGLQGEGPSEAVGKRRPTTSKQPAPNRSAADRSERQPLINPTSARGRWDPPLGDPSRRVQPVPPVPLLATALRLRPPFRLDLGHGQQRFDAVAQRLVERPEGDSRRLAHPIVA